MTTTMTKTAKPALRDLSVSELQVVGGGAGYLKIQEIKGNVAPLSPDNEWVYISVRR